MCFLKDTLPSIIIVCDCCKMFKWRKYIKHRYWNCSVSTIAFSHFGGLFLSVISKYLRDIHIYYVHHLIALTQQHRYTYQNRESSYARAQVMAKYVISMAAILNVP